MSGKVWIWAVDYSPAPEMNGKRLTWTQNINVLLGINQTNDHTISFEITKKNLAYFSYNIKSNTCIFNILTLS